MDCRRNKDEDQGELSCDETGDERAVVATPDTVVDPRTVVIAAVDTVVAVAAMAGPRWTVCTASYAVLGADAVGITLSARDRRWQSGVTLTLHLLLESHAAKAPHWRSRRQSCAAVVHRGPNPAVRCQGRETPWQGVH